MTAQVRTLIASAVAASVIGVPLATAPPASASAVVARADTPGCVTRSEFDQVPVGTVKARVHRVFDTAGVFVTGGAGGYVRAYPQCGGSRGQSGRCSVSIEYGTNRNHVARIAVKRFNGFCH